jgi:RNA-directed DNA polymerase
MRHKWLKSGCMDKRVLYPTEAGVPPGGICSPVLAHLALDRLERFLKAHYPATPRRGKPAQGHRVKYAEDCIIAGSAGVLLAQEVTPWVEQCLRERGLARSPEKTRITHIEDGFAFLGQKVRKYAGKLRIKPARKHVKACLGKVGQIVKAKKQATAAHLIAQLNPRRRGWANDHRHVVSQQTC